MILTFLGTGTSTGVPQLNCGCTTCRSSDLRDKRLRASALVEVGGKTLLIDCGPDFRTQLLIAQPAGLDALLITHSHYDHVGGIDDLRPYCTEAGFPVYCQDDVAQDLRDRVPYCFAADPYPGVPRFDLHEVKPGESFMIGDVEVEPLRVMHYKLPMLGFKIGNLAYITDCKTMPESTIARIEGVDTLVINALRIEPHISHISLAQALDLIGKIRPRVAYLTHLSHQMGRHGDVEAELPVGVHIAYDGLTVEIPD